MKSVILLGVWCVSFLPLVALNGWALATLWGWFVTPTFGAAPLQLWQAIGVSLVVAYLTYQPDLSSDNEPDQIWKGLVYATVKPLAALLFGRIYLAIFA